MKLYSTLERRSLLPAVCSQASVRRVSPSALLSWQESALVQALVLAPAASVPAASLPAEAVPATVVPAAVGATEPVRVEGAVRVTEPGSDDQVRTGKTRISTTDVIQLDRGIQVQGTNGFDAKHGMTAPKPNGGVRGIPPRGRPV
ncbi:hypothetical protein AB0M46_47710 [Dactylosporangium sp. NPDC051485]|uniref:hypothetical protein n=1 Tax=Dactylosporangium sp. NPDC051485 TaxID=3154846 RepID=UPI00341A86C4